MTDYFALNRAHWDEVTPHHLAAPFYRAQAFRDGEVVLDEVARESVGDVAGKRLLHLQCHIGLDTLSLARMGADVTGLDFSPAALEAARTLSAETDVPGRFIQANVLEPPADLTGFDIVFASWGVHCWIPDMAAWMRTAAAALEPGGRLVFLDDHPVRAMLSGEEPSPYSVRYPYDSPEALIFEDIGDYTDRDLKMAANRTAEWAHGLGTLVNAAIDAGLVVRRLDELDRVPWRALPQLAEAGAGFWRLPADAPAFPLGFRLLADKP
ncbi:MAG TPA: methyltransferase domain-containing protein [Caulobacteraceae bacterium]|nr:methyltransferase domain-containing protein [Caulobacteraceae bacterium]